MLHIIWFSSHKHSYLIINITLHKCSLTISQIKKVHTRRKTFIKTAIYNFSPRVRFDKKIKKATSINRSVIPRRLIVAFVRSFVIMGLDGTHSSSQFIHLSHWVVWSIWRKLQRIYESKYTNWSLSLKRQSSITYLFCFDFLTVAILRSSQWQLQKIEIL